MMITARRAFPSCNFFRNTINKDSAASIVGQPSVPRMPVLVRILDSKGNRADDGREGHGRGHCGGHSDGTDIHLDVLGSDGQQRLPPGPQDTFTFFVELLRWQGAVSHRPTCHTERPPEGARSG